MNTNTINSKNVISGVNDLATKCPKISAMWSAKNTYTPSEVSVGSNKKAWFICPDCKQEFEASICNVVHTVQNATQENSIRRSCHDGIRSDVYRLCISGDSGPESGF